MKCYLIPKLKNNMILQGLFPPSLGDIQVRTSKMHNTISTISLNNKDKESERVLNSIYVK